MANPVLLLPTGGLDNLSCQAAIDSTWCLLPPRVADAGQRDDLKDESFTAAEISLRASSAVPSRVDACRAFDQASRAVRGAENACNSPGDALSLPNSAERVQAVALVAAESIRTRYHRRPDRPLGRVHRILESIPLMSMADAHVSTIGVDALEAAFSTWHTVDTASKLPLCTNILVALSLGCSQLQPQSLAWPDSKGRVAAILDDTVAGLLTLMAEDNDLSTIQRTAAIQILCRLVLSRSKPSKIARFSSILARVTTRVAAASILGGTRQAQIWPIIARHAAETKHFNLLCGKARAAIHPLAGSTSARLLPAKAGRARRTPSPSTPMLSAAIPNATNNPPASWPTRVSASLDSTPSAAGSAESSLGVAHALLPGQQQGTPQVAAASVARLRSRPRVAVANTSSAMAQASSVDAHPKALLGAAHSAIEERFLDSSTAATGSKGGQARSTTPSSETGIIDERCFSILAGVTGLVAVCVNSLTEAQADSVLGQLPQALAKIASGQTAQSSIKYADWLAACLCEHVQKHLEASIAQGRPTESEKQAPDELWDAAAAIQHEDTLEQPEPAHNHAYTVPLAWGDLQALLQSNEAPKDRYTSQLSTFSLVAAGQNTFNELCQPHAVFSPHAAGADLSHLDEIGVVAVAAGNEHTVLLTAMGQVLSVGYNAHGSCGTGDSKPRTILQTVPVPADYGTPIEVFASNGCEHTILLTDSGRVLACGSNKSGQLGTGLQKYEEMARSVRENALFSPVAALNKVCVRTVGVSYNHTLFATDNDLFGCGKTSCFGAAHEFGAVVHEPVRLRLTSSESASQSATGPDSQSRAILSVLCGQEHSVLLMESGTVLVAGSNQFGQLGRPLRNPSDVLAQSTGFIPVSTGALANQAVQQIACGYFHTMALTSKGQVVVFGRNDYGQLGLGHACSVCFVPTVVELPHADGDGSVIGAGCYHSLIATQNNQLWGFGRNQHGQLFMPPGSNFFTPALAQLPRGGQIERIKCGFYHSILMLKDRTLEATASGVCVVRSADVSTLFQSRASNSLLASTARRHPGKHGGRSRKQSEKVQWTSQGVLLQVNYCGEEVISVGAALACIADYLAKLSVQGGSSLHRQSSHAPTASDMARPSSMVAAALQMPAEAVGEWPMAAVSSAVAALITCASVNSKRFWAHKDKQQIPHSWAFLDTSDPASSGLIVPTNAAIEDQAPQDGLQTPFTDISSNQYRHFCMNRVRHTWLVASISLSLLSGCSSGISDVSLCSALADELTKLNEPEAASDGLMLVARLLEHATDQHSWNWLLEVLSMPFPAAVVDQALQHAQGWAPPCIEALASCLPGIYRIGCDGGIQAWSLLALLISSCNPGAAGVVEGFLTTCISELSLPGNGTRRAAAHLEKTLDLCLLYFSQATAYSDSQLAFSILCIDAGVLSSTTQELKLVALCDVAALHASSACAHGVPGTLRKQGTSQLSIRADNWKLASERGPVEALLGSGTQAAASAAILASPGLSVCEALLPLQQCFDSLFEQLLQQEVRTNILLGVTLRRSTEPLHSAAALGVSGEELLLNPGPFLGLYSGCAGITTDSIATICSPFFNRTAGQFTCYGFSDLGQALRLILKSVFLLEVVKSGMLAKLLDCTLHLKTFSNVASLAPLQRRFKAAASPVLEAWRLFRHTAGDESTEAACQLSQCAWARHLQRDCLMEIVRSQSRVARVEPSRWGVLRAAVASLSQFKQASKEQSTPSIVCDQLQTLPLVLESIKSGASTALATLGTHGRVVLLQLDSWASSARMRSKNRTPFTIVRGNSDLKVKSVFQLISSSPVVAGPSAKLHMQLLIVRLKLLVRMSAGFDLWAVNFCTKQLRFMFDTASTTFGDHLLQIQLLEVLVACFMRRKPHSMPNRLLFCVSELLCSTSQDFNEERAVHIRSAASFFMLAIVRSCRDIDMDSALTVVTFTERLLTQAAPPDIDTGACELFQHFGTSIPRAVDSFIGRSAPEILAIQQALCEGRFHLAAALTKAGQVEFPLRPPQPETGMHCTTTWEEHVWIYSTADSITTPKIVLHRGASAAFSCPVILLRPDGSIELAVATDRNPSKAAFEWHQVCHWLSSSSDSQNVPFPDCPDRANDLVWTVLQGDDKIQPHRWHLVHVKVTSDIESCSTDLSFSVDGGDSVSSRAAGLPRPSWVPTHDSWSPSEPPISIGAIRNSNVILPDQILSAGGTVGPAFELCTCFSQRPLLGETHGVSGTVYSFGHKTGVLQLEDCAGFDGQVALGVDGPVSIQHAKTKRRQQPWASAAAVGLAFEALSKSPSLSAESLIGLVKAIIGSHAKSFICSNDLLLRLLLQAFITCFSTGDLLQQCGLLPSSTNVALGEPNDVHYIHWLLHALGVVETMSWGLQSGGHKPLQSGTEEIVQLIAEALVTQVSAQPKTASLFCGIPYAESAADVLFGFIGEQNDCFAARTARLSVQSVLLQHAQFMLQQQRWRNGLVDTFVDMVKSLSPAGEFVHGDLQEVYGLGKVRIGAATCANGDSSESPPAVIHKTSTIKKFMEAVFCLEQPTACGSTVSYPSAHFTSLTSTVGSEFRADSSAPPPEEATIVRQCFFHDAVMVTRSHSPFTASVEEPSSMPRFCCELQRSCVESHQQLLSASELLVAIDCFQHLHQDPCICPAGSDLVSRGKDADCVLALRAGNRKRSDGAQNITTWLPSTTLSSRRPHMILSTGSDAARRVLTAVQHLCQVRQAATKGSVATHEPVSVYAALSLQSIQNDALYVLRHFGGQVLSSKLVNLPTAWMRISSPVFLESAAVRLHARALRLRCSQLMSSPHYLLGFRATLEARLAIRRSDQFQLSCINTQHNCESSATKQEGPRASTAQQQIQPESIAGFTAAEISQASVLMAVLGFSEEDLAACPPRAELEPLLEMGFRLHWCLVSYRLCHHDLSLSSTWLLDNSQFLHAVQEQLDADASGDASGPDHSSALRDQDEHSYDEEQSDGGSNSDEQPRESSESSIHSSDDDNDSIGEVQTEHLWQLARQAETAAEYAQDQAHHDDPLGSLLQALELLGGEAAGSRQEFRTPPRQSRSVNLAPRSPFSPASLASQSTAGDAQSDYGHFDFDAAGNLVAVSSPNRHSEFGMQPEQRGGACQPKKVPMSVNGNLRLHIPQHIDCTSLVHLVQMVIEASTAQNDEDTPTVMDEAAATAQDSLFGPDLQHQLDHQDDASSLLETHAGELHLNTASGAGAASGSPGLHGAAPSAQGSPAYSPSSLADYSAAGSALDLIRRRRVSPAASVPSVAHQATAAEQTEQVSESEEPHGVNAVPRTQAVGASSFLNSIQHDIDELLPRISEARDQLASLMSSSTHISTGTFTLQAATDIILEVDLHSNEATLLAPFDGGDIQLSPPIAPVCQPLRQERCAEPVQVATSVWSLARLYSLGSCCTSALHSASSTVWAGPNPVSDSLHARVWGTSCAEEVPSLANSGTQRSSNFPCHLLATYVLDEDHFPADRLQALVPSMEFSQYFKSGASPGGWDAFGQRLFDRDATVFDKSTDSWHAVNPASFPWVPVPSEFGTGRTQRLVAENSVRRSAELAMCQFLQLLVVNSSCRPFSGIIDSYVVAGAAQPNEEELGITENLCSQLKKLENAQDQSRIVNASMGTMEDAERPFMMQKQQASIFQFVLINGVQSTAASEREGWQEDLLVRSKLYLSKMADLLALPAEDLAYFDLHSAAGATEGMLAVLGMRDLLLRLIAIHPTEAGNNHSRSLEAWSALKMCLFRSNGCSNIGTDDTSLTAAAILGGQKRGGGSISDPTSWLAHAHLLHKESAGRMIFNSLMSSSVSSGFCLTTAVRLLCGALLELRTAAMAPVLPYAAFGRRLSSTSDNQASYFGNVELADWVLCLVEFSFDHWFERNSSRLELEHLLTSFTQDLEPSDAGTTPLSLLCGPWLLNQLICLLSCPNLAFRYIIIRKLDCFSGRLLKVFQAAQHMLNREPLRVVPAETFQMIQEHVNAADLRPFCHRQLRVRLSTEPWDGRMYFTALTHTVLALLNKQNELQFAFDQLLLRKRLVALAPPEQRARVERVEVFDTSSSSVSLHLPILDPNAFLQVQVRRVVGTLAGISVYPVVSVVEAAHSAAVNWPVQAGSGRILTAGLSHSEASLIISNLQSSSYFPHLQHVAAVSGEYLSEPLDGADPALTTALAKAAKSVAGPWQAAISDIFEMIKRMPLNLLNVAEAAAKSTHAGSWLTWKRAELQLLHKQLCSIPRFRDAKSMLHADSTFVALWCAAHVLGCTAASIQGLLWGFPLCVDSSTDFSAAVAAGTTEGTDKTALQCVWAIKQFLSSFVRKINEADWDLFEGSTSEVEALIQATEQTKPLVQFLSEEAMWKSVATTRSRHICIHRLASSTTYLLRCREVQAGSEGLQASRWTEPQAIRTAAPPGFTWDVQPMLKAKPVLLESAYAGGSIAGSVTASMDGLSVTHTVSERWSMVNSTVGFSSGINRWSVRIDRTPTAYLFIGVARITANPQVFLGGDEHGWGFLGDRALYHDRNKARTYGRRFGVHDVIGCELNCDEGTLSFSLNGSPLGIAFRNLTGVLYPAVSFYNHGQKVTLIQQPAADLVKQADASHYKDDDTALAFPPMPPPVNVDMRLLSAPYVFAMRCPGACPGSHVLGTPVGNVRSQLLMQVSQQLSTVTGRVQLPQPFIQLVLAAFTAGRLFWEGRLVRCSTASGFDVSLNATPQALFPFGVSAGDRILCKLGECTVKGVRDGRLWVKPLDGKHVWYLTQHQVSASMGVTADALSWSILPSTPHYEDPISFQALVAESQSLPEWHAFTGHEQRELDGPGRAAGSGRKTTACSYSKPSNIPPPPALASPPRVKREAQSAVATAASAAGLRVAPDCEGNWTSSADRRSDCGLILLQPAETVMEQNGLQDLEALGATWMLTVNGVGKAADSASLALIPSVVQHWKDSDFDRAIVETMQLAAISKAQDNVFMLNATDLLAALGSDNALHLASGNLTQLQGVLSVSPEDSMFDAALALRVLHETTPLQLCIARALFLLQLNDVLAPCMPIFNMRARHHWQGHLQQELMAAYESSEATFSMHRALSWNAVGELTALRDLGQTDPFQVVEHCRAIKSKLFSRIKQQVLNTVLSRTNLVPPSCEDEFEHPPELPRLVIDRPGAVRALQSELSDQRLLGSVFGQLMRSLAWVPTAYLRLGYSHPMDDNQLRAFYVSFLGEGVDDYGGAYREVFTQAVAELQTNRTGLGAACLPVLQPSPNATSGLGNNRGWFVAASGEPSKSAMFWGSEFCLPQLLLSPLQASASRFAGNLMGMAIRGRILLDLQFAESTWRLLANDPVNIASIPDIVLGEISALPEVQLHGGLPVWLLSMAELRAIDHSAASLLDQLLRIHEQAAISAADMHQVVTAIPDLTFATYLSGGKQVPLVQGGMSRGLRIADIPKFALFTLAARSLEGYEVLTAMRAGIVDVISDALLPLLTGPELRDTLCGAEDFDVDLLKRNTECEEGMSTSDEHVQFLWDALRSMTAAERAAFLRFVWARARLPPTDAAFTQKLKLQNFEPAGVDTEEDPAVIQAKRDAMLPKSSTCFGALYLPRYSSANITLARLNYAAKHCISMDADFLTSQDEVGNW